MAVKQNRNFQRASIRSERLQVQALRYVPMVPSIARNVERQIPASFDLSNLIKNGVTGLFEGAKNYPRHSRIPFRALAKYWIKSGILEGVRSESLSDRRLAEKRSGRTRQTEPGDAFLVSLFGLRRVMNESSASTSPLSEIREGDA